MCGCKGMNIRSLIIAFVSLVIVSVTHHSSAQADKMLVNLGNEMYSYGDVEDAFDVYEQAIGMNPNNVMAYYMSGRCLLATSTRKGESVEFFKKAYELDPEVSSKIFWYIGQGYHFNYQFDEARNYYLLFKEELETNRRLFLNEDVAALKASVERKIYECENAKEYLKAIKKVTITNLGEHVNSEADDYAPTLTVDESRLIFTSRRQGSTGDYKDVDNHYFEDIWASDKVGEDWGYALNMGEDINTEGHESNVGISPDNKSLFIYRSDKKGDNILVTEYEKERWQKAKYFKSIISDGRETSASISSDGKYLFFSSSRENGFGGLDLYRCTWLGKEWSDPVNMGDDINSTFDEESPSYDVSTNTLYFSSMGHKGMGGYDVYFSVFDPSTGSWSRPENLGMPVNTPQDDLHFIITQDSDIAFFASSRDDSYGGQDIYSVSPAHTDSIINPDTTVAVADTMPKGDKPVLFSLVVEDEDGETIQCLLKISDQSNNENLLEETLETGIFSKSYSFDEEKTYTFTLEAEGKLFLTFNQKIPAMGFDTLRIQKLKVLKAPQLKKVNILRNVYFAFDKHTLDYRSTKELNLLEKYLTQNPSVRVEIAGHTCFIGPDGYNQSLSKMRAQAVKNYLVKRGVKASRIISRGYGESKPIATNDDEEEGRELNRRTEFIILSK